MFPHLPHDQTDNVTPLCLCSEADIAIELSKRNIAIVVGVIKQSKNVPANLQFKVMTTQINQIKEPARTSAMQILCTEICNRIDQIFGESSQ